MEKQSKIQDIIQKLDLQPHPEGGFYKETYRSKGEISNAELGDKYEGNRNYCTGIYFMLTSDTFSAFHKINQDEAWHFYMGSPIKIHVIDVNGNYSNTVVGTNFNQGETPQFVVKGGDWFAAEVLNENSFSLVGCTVAPGFDFRDFVLPEQKELTELFPQHQEIIKKFTRS